MHGLAEPRSLSLNLHCSLLGLDRLFRQSSRERTVVMVCLVVTKSLGFIERLHELCFDGIATVLLFYFVMAQVTVARKDSSPRWKVVASTIWRRHSIR